MNVKKLEKELNNLQAELQAVEGSISELQAESENLVVGEGNLVERLEEIETALVSRTRLRTALKNKVKQTAQQLNAAERQERERQAAGLRKQETKAIQAVVSAAGVLQQRIEELHQVEHELGKLQVQGRRVIPSSLLNSVKYFLKQKLPHLERVSPL